MRWRVVSIILTLIIILLFLDLLNLGQAAISYENYGHYYAYFKEEEEYSSGLGQKTAQQPGLEHQEYLLLGWYWYCTCQQVQGDSTMLDTVKEVFFVAWILWWMTNAAFKSCRFVWRLWRRCFATEEARDD